MKIEIVACDSFGVRSLFLSVETSDFKIGIDPGISLSPKRFGLPPHIKELDRFRELRERLFREVSDCDFLFISHYHHDHFVPFYKKDYVVSGFSFAERVYDGKVLFLKSPYEGMNYNQKVRGKKLIKELRKRGIKFSIVEETKGEIPFFYDFLYHGGEKERGGVGVIGICDGDEKFLYGSDFQFLDLKVIDILKNFKPDIFYSAGPPVYLNVFDRDMEEFSLRLIRESSRYCGELVLDHHLLRSKNYREFMEKSGVKNLKTGAEFMGREDEPLEFMRKDNFLCKE